MFITKRKALKLELEFESIMNLVLSIYNKIGHDGFDDFRIIIIYTIMQMQRTDELEDVSKDLIKRIIFYNDSILRANSSIKIGNVKLPPIIII